MRPNPRSVFLTLAALGLLLALAALSKDPPKAELVLKDSHGQRVRLSDLRGKPVVLNFWATWCIPCNAEMPMLVEAEKKYGPKGVVFVGASLDERKTQPRIPEFVAKHQVGFAVWVGAAADDLDKLAMGPAVPATAFLDTDGHIVARIWGQVKEEELIERLDWLLDPKTSAQPAPLVKHIDTK